MALLHPIKALDQTLADNRPDTIKTRVQLDFDMLEHPEKYDDLAKQNQYHPVTKMSWKPFILLGVVGLGLLILAVLTTFIMLLSR